MSDEKEKMVVVFIDSLGGPPGTEYDDLKHMPWVRENMSIGRMDASPVYVTPTVLGSIYTGTSPTENGMPAVSRYNQEPRMRPFGSTIPEIAAATDDYENVLQLGLPFIVPAEVQPQGNYWHSSAGMNQSVFQPGEAQPAMTTPAPAGEIDKPDENLDLAYNIRVDNTTQTFANARNLMEMWDVDLMFVSFRVTDSYVHYQYDTPIDEGGEKTYRQGILEQVDREISYLADQAKVMVFGDHGGRHLEELFRINRWLMDHGYLEVDIDHDWRQKAIDYGVMDDPTDDELDLGQVIQAGVPGVSVDEENSVAIGDDPFSTGLTLLDGADETNVEDLIAELSAQSEIREVEWTTALFGNGQLEEECPDLYAVREPGVFVSGNLHPELGGAEITRSGVHHRIGLYGATDNVSPSNRYITPQDLFDVITHDFLDLSTDEVETLGEATPQPAQESDDRDVQEHLRDLGYI